MELSYFSPTSIIEPDWKLNATPAALAEFRAIATHGATMLPPLRTNDLTVTWLEALWKEATEGPVRQGIEILGKDRTGRLTELRGKIDRVFQASLSLCRQFEREAMQVEYTENRLSTKRESYDDSFAVLMLRHKHEMAIREIERQKELEHERKLAEIRVAHVAPVHSSASSAKESSRFKLLDKHYQVIRFDNCEYELKPIQSTVIRVLHKAYVENRGSVGIKEIQAAIGVNSGKMSGWFRDKKNKYLYGTLIVQKAGSRNHYRIDL